MHKSHDDTRYEILKAMNRIEDFWFGKGETFKAWPGSRKEIEKVMDHAKSLYEMCKRFFEVNFPDYDARAKFRCFDNGPAALPEEVRLQMIEHIAKRENCCLTKTRQESNAMIPHRSELYVACQDNKTCSNRLGGDVPNTGWDLQKGPCELC